MMGRMQSLRLMPSHTYFYKKLSEYGKDHDLEIKTKVDMEGKRKTAVIISDQQTVHKVEHESTNHQACVATIKVKTCHNFQLWKLQEIGFYTYIQGWIYRGFRVGGVRTPPPLAMARGGAIFYDKAKKTK